MLPQASAPFPSKSNLSATTSQQPEPLHALRKCLFLLPGYLILVKQCQIWDWATSCGLLSPQTHSHGSPGQCISRARIWEGVNKSSCSHMFVLSPFPCIYSLSLWSLAPALGLSCRQCTGGQLCTLCPWPSSRGSVPEWR